MNIDLWTCLIVMWKCERFYLWTDIQLKCIFLKLSFILQHNFTLHFNGCTTLYPYTHFNKMNWCFFYFPLLHQVFFLRSLRWAPVKTGTVRCPVDFGSFIHPRSTNDWEILRMPIWVRDDHRGECCNKAVRTKQDVILTNKPATKTHSSDRRKLW